MRVKRGTAKAELFVWTDVDSNFEADFNRWYDREHMEERISIPGFVWGRRLRLTAGAGPRYLALYRVENFGVFTSEAYQQAFKHQTDWSNRNFPRMRNPRRRVMGVSLEVGVGVGSAWGIVNLRQPKVDVDRTAPLLEEVCRIDGVFSAYGLEPDIALSTPLPMEDKDHRPMDAFAMISAESQAALGKALYRFCALANVPEEQAACFALSWELRAEDL
jgi:hypothetical protein